MLQLDSSLDDFDSAILFQVIQFLNAPTANHLALQSKRFYYLVQHYRQVRGPQIVATIRDECSHPSASSSSSSSSSSQQLERNAYHKAIDQIQAPPQLVLAFVAENTANDNTTETSLSTFLTEESTQPNHTVVLGSISQYIQTIVPPTTTATTTTTDQPISTSSSSCAYKTRDAVMLLAGLPPEKTLVKPFCLPVIDEEFGNDDFFSFDIFHADDVTWKLFIVYACGDGAEFLENYVKTLQKAFPDATVVGGICDEIFVSVRLKEYRGPSFQTNKIFQQNTPARITAFDLPIPTDPSITVDLPRRIPTIKYSVEFVSHGICGVALAGDIPVKSVVSRGVLSDYYTQHEPQTQTNLYVHQADRIEPSNFANMFQGHTPPPYHLIRQIIDRDNGKIYSYNEILSQFGNSDFLGLRPVDHDGFFLESIHPLSHNLSTWMVMNSEVESYVGYNVDLYSISGEACMRDMDDCMRKLLEQTQHEHILGALLFSCNGRGPLAGPLIREEQGDAIRFAKTFPTIPCLGFYAGGEIGPRALAGRKSVFQQGDSCLQGFTAVFALFIVPKIDLSLMRLDDSEEAVSHFIRKRLGIDEII